MALNPGTNRQVPEHSIMDAYNKQTYLGNQFIYSASTALTGSSEVPLYVLQNPAVTTAAFPATQQALFLNFRKVTCITASQSILLRFYFNPVGVSGGTPETPVNLRPLSTATGIATLALKPTVSGSNGTLVTVLSSNAFAPDLSNVLAVLDSGQSLLVTAQPSGDCSVIAELGWYQL